MDNNGEVVYLYLDDIIPNRFQPREVFDDQALKELAVSIKEHGVIQPIIVRKVENKYEIIAGERRYKASTMAGLTKIPAIVKNLDDKESSKVALIENLQRKDLSPIEEARTYQKILELEDGMTQEQLAATMGKTQSSVSNKLRLLDLPEEIQDALLKEKISERHARSILSIEDKNDQIKLMDKVISEKMTVRELDKEIKEMKEGPQEEKEEAPEEKVENGPENSVVDITPIQEAPTEPTQASPEMPKVDIQLDPSVVVTEPAPAAPENGETNNNVGDGNTDTQITDITPQTEGPKLATFNNNPTSVDINQIRENSTDINQISNTNSNSIAQPTMEVKDLLNNAEQPKEEFKFVPNFGDNLGANNTVTEVTTAPEQPMFAQFFDSNTSQAIDNNTLASSILTNGISVPSVTPTKDVSVAITNVKNAITSLQNEGYNVTFEESDSPQDYKITIQINKN